MMVGVGRTTREEEDAQGPGEEAHHVHPPLRQRHHDRRQEEDEPQPDFIRPDVSRAVRCDVGGWMEGG